MVANDLRKKIIYSSPKLINPILSNITDKDLSIDEKVCKLKFSKKTNIIFFLSFAECYSMG
jgi:hypothetical protein